MVMESRYTWVQSQALPRPCWGILFEWFASLSLSRLICRQGVLAFIHYLSLFGIKLCSRFWKGSSDQGKGDSRHSQPRVMVL